MCAWPGAFTSASAIAPPVSASPLRELSPRRAHRHAAQALALRELIPKGMFSRGFSVGLLLNKFSHGMPLFRILKMLEMNHLCWVRPYPLHPRFRHALHQTH